MKKRQFSKAEIGDVIQRIYDSEIHAKIEWLWDGGFETGIGCLGTFEDVGNTYGIEQAVSDLAFRITQNQPDSGFGRWYLDRPEGWCSTCEATEDGCQCPMPERA